MLSNYFKIALRNLLKFKGYTAINLGGLAIGVAACLLILHHVMDEMSYDKHHQNMENLYRIDTEFIINDNHHKSGATPPPMAAAVRNDFPEVEQVARLCKVPDVEKWILKKGDQAIFEKRGYWTDSTFFEVLTYDFLEGNPTTALDEPYTVVISNTIAKKLFGEASALNEIIEINSSWGENDYKITGVFDDEKYNSFVQGKFFVSMRSANIGQRFYGLQEWGGNNLYGTVIRLKDGTNPKDIEAKFPAFMDKYASARLKELGMDKRQYLTPVADIYLKSEGGNWFGPRGNLTFIYILSLVAGFILLIACINFMNLATAKATLRAKEVGVRKVIGASRGMLIKQFMSEAFIYASLAVILAYVLSELFLPVFNTIVEKDLSGNLLKDGQIVMWLIAFVAVITLLAGSYPALYLSSFSPSKIFKNNFSNKLSSQQIRKGLVVIQFVISIALIQGILVINEQMDYMRNQDLGFNPEAKLVLPVNTYEVFENFAPLRNELLKNKQIEQVAGTSNYPKGSNMESYFYFKEGQSPDEGFHTYSTSSTVDFMKMMDFELIKGRLFDPNRPGDTTSVTVISEKAMEGIGFTLDNILGQRIFREWEGVRYEWEVIGVVKDFHDSSLHYEMNGQVFVWDPSWISYIIAEVQTENLPELLKEIEASWIKVNPEVPFEFHFMDEQLQQNYQEDQKVSSLTFMGALLAIFISCLGLLGLAAFAAERREKEIGVRKVLGASISNIITLLSKDFLRLVFFALIVATPIAWYMMQNWLQDFHYHIEMPWWIFAVAGVLAIGAALITIGYQSMKAAKINPVDSLRNE